jgi:phage antirepressor YoqD-like protein
MAYLNSFRREYMPVVINDETYYRKAEVCRMIGISRNNLFRWLKEGIFPDVEYRDWRLLEQRPTMLRQ